MKVIGRGSSNGIDTDFYYNDGVMQEKARLLRSDLKFRDADIVFIFIGRVVKDKGINELIQAFDVLSKQYEFIKLVLVGPFEDELDPIDALSRKTIDENLNIVSVGYQHDVRPYLAASNVLVFPSYREGFPNVPMQAGCFNLPCIVTDINGCNEIIENEVNGLIIPVKNTTALQSAMERMIVDNKLREQCAFHARKMIEENYGQAFVWHSIFEEYTNSLKEKGFAYKDVSKIPETTS